MRLETDFLSDRSQHEKEYLLRLNKKDFVVTIYRGSGKGGQARNKTSSAVRIQHPASGAMGEASDSRSQHDNRITAFQRCIQSDTFVNWMQKQVSKAMVNAQEVERSVERSMRPEFLKVEVGGDDGWTEVDFDTLT